MVWGRNDLVEGHLAVIVRVVHVHEHLHLIRILDLCELGLEGEF